MNKTVMLRISPIALGIALAFGHASSMAQVSAAAGGPKLAAAANGVPMVNIVAPNAAGVSTNLYNQFNVSSSGLILNNATQAVVTQLGGAIPANASLGTTGAKIILNEVVQTNPSALDGYIEVGGTPADVVIANPSGITCNGCGFVNTPRVTLTTGTPTMSAAGALTGFSVAGGTIAIEGTGLDGTRQTYFDILARAITLTGQINAQDLQLVGGTENFDYASRTASAVAGGSGAPLFAIDSSALGGMYADRIRLVATENGVGVRILGNVAASTTDLSINSAGDILIQGKMSAVGNVDIDYTGTAPDKGAIMISGASNQTTIGAGGNLSLNSGVGGISLSGAVLGGNADTSFTGASLTDNGGSGALRFAGGALAVNVPGAVIIDGAGWNGSSSLTINAGTVNLGSNSSITSATSGTATGAISLTSSGDLNLGGSIAAGSALDLESSIGAILIGSGAKISSTGGASVLAATTVTNSGSLEAGGRVTLAGDLSGQNLQVNNEGVLSSGDLLTITGYGGASGVAITNYAGATAAGNTLSINAQLLSNSGAIQGVNGATIDATSLTNAAGAKLIGSTGASTTSITSSSLDNDGVLQSGGILNLNLGASVTNSSTGQILAGGDLRLQTTLSSFTNSGVIQSGGTLLINEPSLALSNAANAQISGNELNLALGSLSNSGLIQATTSTTMALESGGFSNNGSASSLITSTTGSTASNLSAFNWSNAGVIYSVAPLNLQVGGSFSNTSTGAVVANGALAITGPGGTSLSQFANSPGGLVFGGTSLSITNFYEISNGLNWTQNSSQQWVAQIGEIQSNGLITLTALPSAGTITNYGFIDGNGGVNISAQSFRNITVEPPTSSTTSYGAVPNSQTYNIGYDSSAICAIAPEVCYANGSGTTYGINPVFGIYGYIPYGLNTGMSGPPPYVSTQNGPLPTYAEFFLSTGMAPYTQPPNAAWTLYNQEFIQGDLYRAWSGEVYKANAYLATPVQAHVDSLGGDINITLGATGGYNSGGQISSYNNINFNALPGVQSTSFVNETISHMVPIYTAEGIEQWVPQTGPGAFEVSYTGANQGWVLGNQLVTAPADLSGPITTQSVSFIGATIQAGGTVTFAAQVTPTNSTSGAQFSIPGATSRTVGTGTSVAMSVPATIAGLSIILPTNPNGLYILDLAPGASYLIESNPRYTNLLNPGFGSEYLITTLGLNPDETSERLGDPSYEDSLVQQEVSNLTGLALIDGATNSVSQMQTLMNNAVWEAHSLNLSLGVALTPAQVNSLQQDMVWLVQTTVDGHTVLAPVVYLASASRAAASTTATIAATNIAVSGSSSFTNEGNVTATNSLNIQTTGDINNLGGSISGGNVALTSTSGNINSTTLVNRYGDSANHNDVIGSQASITSTGNLALTATTGNITATGSNISAGGNANVTAGGNVSLVNQVLESEKTTHTSSGNWLTGESSTTTVTINQSSNGSSLSAGGNLTINAGNDLNVTGSQVAGGNNVAVNATNINVVNGTTTNSNSVSTSSSGFTSGNMGIGYSSSSSNSSYSQTNVIASGISAGHDATLKGSQTVTVTGSDLAAGNNLNINTQTLTTNAAQNTATASSSSSGWGISAGLSGNTNSAGTDFGGSSSNSNANGASSIARVSTLTSGGNMNLDTGSTGTINAQGTQVFAGGNLTQTGQTITYTAAQSTTSSSSSSNSIGVGMQSGANYNVGTAAGSASQGLIPSVGAPSVMTGITVTDNSSSSSQNGTTAVVGSIVARGNVTSISTGTTTLDGTQIQAGNQATIGAGTLNYNAAQNTSNSASNSTSISAGVQGGVDITGKPVGGGEGSYSNSNSSGNSTTAVTGTLTANNGVTIVTTGDANFTGTNIASGNGATIAAGGNVNFNQANNTSSSSNSSQSYSGSLGKDQSGAGDNAQGSFSAAQSNGSGSSSTAVVGSVTAQGGISVSAGANGSLTMQGTNLQSPGNISLTAGQNVNLGAATSTSNSSNSSWSAAGSAGKGDSGSNANGSFQVGNGSTSSSTQQGGVIQGRNIAITSGQDTNITGTQIAANGGTTINTGGNLNVQSAQSTTSNSSTSYGASAGGSSKTPAKSSDGSQPGDAAAGNVGFNYGNNNGNTLTNQNATISGGSVTINTAKNTTIAGGNVTGANVKVNVGGNLTVTSVADTSSSSSSNAGGYLGAADPSSNMGKQGQYGGQLRDGISANGGSSSSNSSNVGLASGIQGAGSTTVNVLTGTTTLTGANIGSNGNTALNTAGLSTSGITQGTSSSSGGFAGGLTASGASTPTASPPSSSATSSTINSSIGGQPIQASVSVAAVTSALNQPGVQTALLLNRGLSAAVATYGNNIPVSVMQQVLQNAGVTPPANASASQLRSLIDNAVATGKGTLVQSLTNSNIPTSQVTNLVNSISLAN